MKNIAIFVSGSGTNAVKIIERLHGHSALRVKALVCNNPKAGIITKAATVNVEVKIIDRKDCFETTALLNWLKENNIDYLVLAGYLWLIPENLIKAYNNKIINIHPALLPKYGGKGMYGARVHHAVIENKERESGITIHFVNERFDEGKIIFQAKCEVEPSETVETLSKKIQQLEHRHFPETIEQLWG